MLGMFENNDQLQDKIQDLTTELSVYKRAFNEVENEKKTLEMLYSVNEKQKEDLENQLKAS